jgi:hypothetical protein
MPTKKGGPRPKSKPTVINNITLQPGEQVASYVKDTKLTPSIFAKPYAVQEICTDVTLDGVNAALLNNNYPRLPNLKWWIVVETYPRIGAFGFFNSTSLIPPVAIVQDYDRAQQIAGILNDEHEKNFPTCAACAIFGAPTWQGDIGEKEEGWYHYTAKVHPFKEKYVKCARLNKDGDEKVVASYGPEILQDLRRASDVMDRPISTSPKTNLHDLATFIGRHLAAMHEFKTGRDRDKFIEEIREIQEDIYEWKLPEPQKADVKQVPFKMDKDQVNFHLKCIAGRILTLVDAMVSNEVQNKAFKKYVKQEFREQFRRVFDIFHPSNQGNCETSEPEELAVANAELF